VSDYCFTTEADAADNLVREGVDAGRIHFVGNVMIDTLVRFREQARHRTAITDLALTPGGYAVLTLHRPSNVDDPATLGQLLAGIAVVQRDFPVVFPVHPRTRERLHGLGVAEGLRLVEPLGYLDFIQLMSGAACVLTDSGGIQEETTVLGVPCLTLRQNTERPVTLKVGTNRLVGLDGDAIAAAWSEIRRGEWAKGRIPELWDGHASERIAKVIVR
jgi:UDP-N-acetylglucosamine 2-epimerase (non-hydrolysing)